MFSRCSNRHRRSRPRGDLRGAESSTAAKDRIVKAREYQATPSVQRYVMLEQAWIGATVHVRAADGWNVLVLKDDDTLALPEIDLAIPLAEFYEGLTFEDHPVEDNDNDQTPPAA